MLALRKSVTCIVVFANANACIGICKYNNTSCGVSKHRKSTYFLCGCLNRPRSHRRRHEFYTACTLSAAPAEQILPYRCPGFHTPISKYSLYCSATAHSELSSGGGGYHLHQVWGSDLFDCKDNLRCRRPKGLLQVCMIWVYVNRALPKRRIAMLIHRPTCCNMD